MQVIGGGKIKDQARGPVAPGQSLAAYVTGLMFMVTALCTIPMFSLHLLGRGPKKEVTQILINI